MYIRGRVVCSGILLGLAALCAGCPATESTVYQKEAFGTTGVFSREYPASSIATCEAARRALLSQGYILADVKADLVNGQKSFQPATDSHVEVAFHIVCVSDSPDGLKSTLFVNALQDRYTIKKTSTSASVGVGALGALSLPFGSSDDSLVKVSSETIPAGPLYERFFGLTDKYLKQLGADYGLPPKKPEPPPVVKVEPPATTAAEKKHDVPDAAAPQDAAKAPSASPPTPNAQPSTAEKPAPGDGVNSAAPGVDLLGPVITPS